MTCWYSAKTRDGSKLALNDKNTPVMGYVGNLRQRIKNPEQLRKLEEAHGRIWLEQIDAATGEVLYKNYSAQSTNAKTAGDTPYQQKYGSVVADAADRLASRGLGRALAEELMAAVATSADPRTAAALVNHAATLAGGAPQRWARQIRDLMGDATPQQLRAIERRVGLAAPQQGPDGAVRAGGVVPRDLWAAESAGRIVEGLRFPDTAPVTTPWLNAPSPKEAQAIVDEMTYNGRRATVPWLQSPAARSATMSGFKVHIYCEDFDDVNEALDRVGTTLVSRGLVFKIATQWLTEKETDPESQCRKGITVYLPERAVAATDAAAISAALGTWHHDRAPGDDLVTAPGVGLRYELLVDDGTDIDRAAYEKLYKPSTNNADPTLAPVADDIREVFDASSLSATTLAEWMQEARLGGDWYNGSNRDKYVRVAQAAAAGVPKHMLVDETFRQYLFFAPDDEYATLLARTAAEARDKASDKAKPGDKVAAVVIPESLRDKGISRLFEDPI